MMVPIGIILSLIFGGLTMGAGAMIEEKSGTSDRFRYQVAALVMVLASTLIAYATGAYFR